MTIKEVPIPEIGVAKSVFDFSQPLIHVVHPVLMNDALVTETHNLV
jgi:hypothetical protein